MLAIGYFFPPSYIAHHLSVDDPPNKNIAILLSPSCSPIFILFSSSFLSYSTKSQFPTDFSEIYGMTS